MTYRIERVQTLPEALAWSARLLRTVFRSDSFTERLLSWQYRENPDGDVVGFEAFTGDDIAAHYVCQPLYAMIGGHLEKGLLSFNTATHPAHQGQGLFTKLAMATYEVAASEGYGFVVGVANANSTPGFIRRLGFQLVAPLTARLGVLPIRTTNAPAAFDRRWDADNLRWRTAHPQRHYVLDDDAIFALIDTPLVRVLLARDPSFRPLITDRARSHKSFRPVTLWIGLEPGGEARSGSFEIPQRFRPSPLNLIFLDLTAAQRNLAIGEVRFRALDFDAY